MPAAHLRKPFDPTQLHRIAAEMEFRRRSLAADIVVVRGLSGTLVASAMSTLFDTPFAVVRKPNEQSHGYAVEVVDEVPPTDGHLQYTTVRYKDWVIVDDLISSGRTVESIIEAAKNGKSDIIRGKCLAVLLYNSNEPSEYFHHYDLDNEIPVYEIGKV